MHIWQNNTDIPSTFSGCVAVIGVFDGIHKGHQLVIEHAVRYAKELQLPSVLITFDPHPRAIVQHSDKPELLTDVAFRAHKAKEYGIDYIYVIRFTPEVAQMSPQEFVEKILVDQLHVRHVIVGENFRFGAKASGDSTRLIQLGKTYGFSAEAVSLLGEKERVYSATSIRQLITSGNVELAKNILGCPYRLEGVVTRGHARGRELGFPTANIAIDPVRVIPGDGVYAGWFSMLSTVRQVEDGVYPPAPIICPIPIVAYQKYPCAISVGTNPTFSLHSHRTVEAFILNASGDLYNCYVAVEFIAKVRGQKKFDSVDELIVSMHHDVEQAQKLLFGQITDDGV